MYKITPGTSVTGETTSGWRLQTRQDKARFLQGLLHPDIDQMSATNRRGSFTVTLDRNSGQTYIKHESYHDDFVEYFQFDELVDQFGFGQYRDDEGLKESPLEPSDYPELQNYLTTGQIPIVLTVTSTSSGQESSQQSDSGEDWRWLENPDEAWEEFQRQMPDLADMLQGRSKEERKQIIEMMQKGLSMQEALSMLEQRGISAAGNGIPPDARDKLATADGFQEPSKATRKYILKHFTRPTAHRILGVARKLDVHPKILADVLREAHERGERIFGAHRKLRARHLVAENQKKKNEAINELKEAVRHWYHAPLTVGTPPQAEASGGITGNPERDLTYDPEQVQMRHKIERILNEAQKMGIFPDGDYRVVLTNNGPPLGEDTGGVTVPTERTILINIELIDQKSAPLTHFVIHELGHLLVDDIGGTTQITEEEYEEVIEVAKRLVEVGQHLPRFSEYVAELRKEMVGESGEWMDKSGINKDDVKAGHTLREELAAELAACAFTGKPVPYPVYKVAEIHLPDAYIERLRPHLKIKRTSPKNDDTNIPDIRGL